MQGKLLWTLPRNKAALYYKQIAIDAAILALWTGCLQLLNNTGAH